MAHRTFPKPEAGALASPGSSEANSPQRRIGPKPEPEDVHGQLMDDAAVIMTLGAMGPKPTPRKPPVHKPRKGSRKKAVSLLSSLNQGSEERNSEMEMKLASILLQNLPAPKTVCKESREKALHGTIIERMAECMQQMVKDKIVTLDTVPSKPTRRKYLWCGNDKSRSIVAIHILDEPAMRDVLRVAMPNRRREDGRLQFFRSVGFEPAESGNWSCKCWKLTEERLKMLSDSD